MTFIVGVDSGGTHTNIRIINPDGREENVELDRPLGGAQSEQELRDVFGEVLSTVTARTRSGDFCIWIGAAGYALSTRPHFEAIAKDFASDVPGLIGISNDAISLLLAHEPEIVTIVAGTGSVAMARRTGGEVVVRGDDDWVVADYGSAFWIGLHGIRAAYRALEGDTDTALIRGLVEHYSPLDHNASNADLVFAVAEIARKIAAQGSGTKPAIASFAPQVTRQAELGDREAQEIVKGGAKELAAAAARVYRDLAAQVADRAIAPRFRLSGGVGYRSRFYEEAFRGELEALLYDVRENAERHFDLTIQPNGIEEAVVLARWLVEGTEIPELDANHPFSIIH